jgi:hypothetical protein
MSVAVGRVVSPHARRFGACRVALVNHVVTIAADGGGLVAGLLEPASRRAAAKRSAARAGQQQAQPEERYRPDRNAVEK